ncbi:MAG: serine hydrolase [Candidatus Atribacteria bacterium]|nr:serine hydrolase [Candidatus Atribacteria bacterium]
MLSRTSRKKIWGLPVFIGMGLLMVLFVAQGVFAQETPRSWSEEQWKQIITDFDGYVQKTMKDWEVPELAIAIVKDDKVIFSKGYGAKEMGKSDPVDEKTVFEIGSTSKAFTATAISMLVDEGKVQWDTPVTQYLPGFQMYDPLVTRELTVRDLLCHRSGLPAYGGDALWTLLQYSRPGPW